eukprot:CAMPEP_0180795990 /NCGR_PEP_ID=MMETSP1038_2-20121128/56520_1 /TAXON_ID=632150 /ORGANISM="Azadinium spinosum, Strain 3D9" /LENGTH=163 /DNA_ID=CAMNT_0022834999 /DNA_START=1114 /DNA_END=1606 /DNA_ORIENTATION=-
MPNYLCQGRWASCAGDFLSWASCGGAADHTLTLLLGDGAQNENSAYGVMIVMRQAVHSISLLSTFGRISLAMCLGQYLAVIEASAGSGQASAGSRQASSGRGQVPFPSAKRLVKRLFMGEGLAIGRSRAASKFKSRARARLGDSAIRVRSTGGDASDIDPGGM